MLAVLKPQKQFTKFHVKFLNTSFVLYEHTRGCHRQACWWYVPSRTGLNDRGSHPQDQSNDSTHRLTYLLTPWCRVFLEKLTGLPLVKKFPAFLWNPKFHYRTHSVRRLSLSCASPIQSTWVRLLEKPNNGCCFSRIKLWYFSTQLFRTTPKWGKQIITPLIIFVTESYKPTTDSHFMQSSPTSEQKNIYGHYISITKCTV